MHTSPYLRRKQHFIETKGGTWYLISRNIQVMHPKVAQIRHKCPECIIGVEGVLAIDPQFCQASKSWSQQKKSGMLGMPSGCATKEVHADISTLWQAPHNVWKTALIHSWIRNVRWNVRLRTPNVPNADNIARKDAPLTVMDLGSWDAAINMLVYIISLRKTGFILKPVNTH